MEELLEDPLRIIELTIPYALNLITAIIILLAGWIVAKWAGRRIMKLGKNAENVDDTIVPIMSKLVTVLIMIITIIAVLDKFGVQMASLIAILGAAGLAVGLALQGTLSNVASGVMLLTFRPFKVGDFININGTFAIVDEIGIFTTEFHTPDNIYMVWTNSKVWGSDIRNFSVNETRRLDLEFGISYSDDIDKAISLIKDEISNDERILPEPEALIAVSNLGDSSVDLIARPWVKTKDWWPTRLALIKAVKQRFDKEGISIPFPQRDVHLFKKN